MADKRGKILLIAFAVLTVVGGGGIYSWVEGGRRMLAEELRLAKSEGMITTLDEFMALVPPVDANLNAAPIYATLVSHKAKKSEDAGPLLAKAKAGIPDRAGTLKLLKDRTVILEIVREAQRRPECRFDRNWEEGFAVLLPEYAYLKDASKLIALQGWAHAWGNRPKDALAEIAKLERIADDCAKEPIDIAFMVSLTIRQIGLIQVAHWAYYYPEHPEYLAALEAHLAKPIVYDRKRYGGADVLWWMRSLDDMSTDEGWKNFGLEGEPPWSDTTPLLAGVRYRGRAALVRSARLRYSALAEYGAQAETKHAEADREQLFAMAAAPGAMTVLMQLDDGGKLNPRELIEPKLQPYRAIVRALKGRRNGKWPTAIKSDDLLSPYDGKPILYKVTGKQITIRVSGNVDEDGADRQATVFPSDPPKPPAKQ